MRVPASQKRPWGAHGKQPQGHRLQLDHILRLPTDPGNGNILRAQTTAAATAVNAQLRADDTKMKQAQKEDIIARLLKMMEIEQAKLIEMDRAKLAKEIPCHDYFGSMKTYKRIGFTI
jgi:hypothetical protein